MRKNLIILLQSPTILSTLNIAKRRKPRKKFTERHSGHNQAGFTLIELIVSLTILSIGLIALINSFSHSLSATGFTQRLTKANLLLQEKIAEVQSTSLPLGTERGDFGQEYPGYRWETSILTTAHSYILEARVSIFWKERNKQKNIEESLLIPSKGLWMKKE